MRDDSFVVLDQYFKTMTICEAAMVRKRIVNQMDPLFSTKNIKILVALVGYISTAVW